MQLFTEINGLRIKYYEYGGTNQRHVLFIHGLGTSSVVWRDIPQALSDKFHTICVDLVGFGGSDIPQVDYTINYFSLFIKSFLKNIGINQGDKISLIGHSLGGYIATKYAIENREQVDKLILIDSSGMLEQPTQLLDEYLNAALESDPKLRNMKLKKVFEKMLAHPGLLPPIVVDIFSSTIERPGAKLAFESAFRNSTSTSINPEELMKIKDVPCLIIWGKKDNLIPIDHIDKFKQILSDAEVIKIEDAGHSPHLEKTAIIYHKISTFL